MRRYPLQSRRSCSRSRKQRKNPQNNGRKKCLALFKIFEKDALDKNSTILERENIIAKNLKKSNSLVYNILYKHEEYVVLKLYASLKNQINLLNEDILRAFSNKDTKNIKLLSLDDFMSILQKELKLNISKTDLNLLLNGLKNQDSQNSIFSYEEFIDNIKNISDKNKEKIEAIYNLALINFNSYFIELKQFIKRRNVYEKENHYHHLTFL